MKRYFCCIDPKGYTVIRNKMAERIGLQAFTIFKALHEAPAKKLTAAELVEHVYRGATNPATRNAVHSTVYYANKRLKRLGIEIRGVNRRQNSFYQIVFS